jgi:hypothetical protein
VPGLTFVLPDLYGTRQSEESQSGLPRLPALERWLSGARRSALPEGWRSWLLATHAPAGATPGAVAAAAHGGDGAGTAAAGAAAASAGHDWLATPVHFVAGLDTIRLHPAGLLRLSAGEQQQLGADFTRVFAGSGWQLLPGERRELLLRGPHSDGVQAGDPARWLGADPSAGLPAGPGAAPLRRLGAEFEMWLHEHAVNRARQARGELPASGLWLWGGGAPMAAPQRGAASGPRLYGEDLLLDGLARWLGQPRPVLPAALAALPAVAGDALVLLAGGSTPDLPLLEALERDWFAPAWQQWRAGRWQSLRLVCGAGAYEARRGALAPLWRSLRAPRPWWQVLLAC